MRPVEYVRGHWVPLGKPDGIGEDEQGWIELAQDTMQLHSMLGLTREDKTPLLKTPILYTHFPVETYGEHMFIHPTKKRLATEQTIEQQKMMEVMKTSPRMTKQVTQII